MADKQADKDYRPREVARTVATAMPIRLLLS